MIDPIEVAPARRTGTRGVSEVVLLVLVLVRVVLLRVTLLAARQVHVVLAPGYGLAIWS